MKRFRIHHAFGLESLEPRLLLASDTGCLLDLEDLPQAASTRAAHAINCFAFDLYEHFEAESGNLFLSPFSISTALAITYAGAAGQTAAEMEQALHFGSEPGIHESFAALIDSLTSNLTSYQVQVANALWPQTGFPIKQPFLDEVASQYGGHAQSLDYAADVEASRATINDWVSDNTNGRIQELIKTLSPETAMVLTNAIFYRALWSMPFDPRFTDDRPFHLEDGTTRTLPTMYMPGGAWATTGSPSYAYSEHGDFRVLEIPFRNEASSMVILLPKDGHTTDDLAANTLVDVNRWLATSPERRQDFVLQMPKFKTTVASQLEKLLPAMGLPSAFGPADFSNMTDAGVFIDQVGHKAFVEVNEQGTEAAAATFVSMVICFAAGTPVLTPQGGKRIEEIEAGDLVLSRDEHDLQADIEPMVVEETYENYSVLLELHIGGRILRATPEHPFFVRDQGWTPAKDLRPGDMLSTDVCSWKELEQIVELEGHHRVYNFRVNKHHTYFVGGRSFGFAVWTHNACGEPDPEFIVDRPFHFIIRDNATAAMLFLGRISDPTIQAENNIVPEFIEPASDALIGDANGDHVVDFADFLVLSQNFGKQTDAVFAEGDFNRDGAVSFADFLLLSTNYGKQNDSADAPA